MSNLRFLTVNVLPEESNKSIVDENLPGKPGPLKNVKLPQITNTPGISEFYEITGLTGFLDH